MIIIIMNDDSSMYSGAVKTGNLMNTKTSGTATPSLVKQPRAASLSRAEIATTTIINIAQSHTAGTRLGTKQTLRAACGVSVGTFNEALALAQARGYISLRPGPGGGIFVNEQSAIARLGNSMLSLDTAEPSIADAIRIRDALDPLLIDDAIDSASTDDIAQFRLHLSGMRAAISNGENIAFVRENWALHRAIAEVSPSALLRSMYLSVLEMLQQHAVDLGPTTETKLPEYIEARYDLHEQIVDAIEAKDRVLARELVHTHNLSG